VWNITGGTDLTLFEVSSIFSHYFAHIMLCLMNLFFNRFL
jgi:hypothetical protein